MLQNKFKTMVILGIIWLVVFVAMLIERAPSLRIGLGIISGACVLWFAYWTISTIFSSSSNGAEKEQEKTNATTNNKKSGK